MNRRFAINAIAGIVVVLVLVLMGRSMNYMPERIPVRAGAASATPAVEPLPLPPVDGSAPAADVAAPEGTTADGGVPTPDFSDAAGWVRHAEIGFASVNQLSMHFAKHGAEFGAPNEEAYLLLAQSLRDRPVGAGVVEARRNDGVTCRFDRTSGAFLAFNTDLTIRTFFRPNDGEAYFERQLGREH